MTKLWDHMINKPSIDSAYKINTINESIPIPKILFDDLIINPVKYIPVNKIPIAVK